MPAVLLTGPNTTLLCCRTRHWLTHSGHFTHKVVTCQPYIGHRSGKVHWPKTDNLTRHSQVTINVALVFASLLHLASDCCLRRSSAVKVERFTTCLDCTASRCTVRGFLPFTTDRTFLQTQETMLVARITHPTHVYFTVTPNCGP